MPTRLAEMHPIARKRHACDHCGCGIEKGARYLSVRLVEDGRAYTWKSHLDCAELAQSIWIECELNWDEGVCLQDEDWSELRLWRGYFPHVICRMELRQALSRIARGEKDAE